jgi:hypothetical protein
MDRQAEDFADPNPDTWKHGLDYHGSNLHGSTPNYGGVDIGSFESVGSGSSLGSGSGFGSSSSLNDVDGLQGHDETVPPDVRKNNT